jgi:hypothetical protein
LNEWNYASLPNLNKVPATNNFFPSLNAPKEVVSMPSFEAITINAWGLTSRVFLAPLMRGSRWLESLAKPAPFDSARW